MSNIGRGGRGGGGGFGRFDGGGGGGGGGWKPEPASMAAILMDEKFNFWGLSDKHRHGRLLDVQGDHGGLRLQCVLKFLT